MARHSRGSERLSSYLENLYLPFMTDVSQLSSPLLLPRHSPADSFTDLEAELRSKSLESLDRGYAQGSPPRTLPSSGAPKRMSERNIPMPHSMPHSSRSPPMRSPYGNESVVSELSSEGASPARSPPSAHRRGPPESPTLSSPAWSVSSTASSIQQHGVDLDPRILPTSSMHSFLFPPDDNDDEDEHRSPPINHPNKRLSAATPSRQANSHTQRMQPKGRPGGRPGRSETAQSGPSADDEVRVRALKKFALRKQIEENRKEREHAKKR